MAVVPLDPEYGAFLSYSRADDDDDRITKLRLRLQDEVRILTGFPFRIFWNLSAQTRKP